MRDVSNRDLPESVREIADVIGRHDALYLIGQLPPAGTRSWRVCFYVPARLTPDHKLVRILGWSQAKTLVRVFGGLILQPSNCNYLYRRHRNRAIAQLFEDEGLSVDVLADQFSLSTRQVKNVLGEACSNGQGTSSRGGACG